MLLTERALRLDFAFWLQCSELLTAPLTPTWPFEAARTVREIGGSPEIAERRMPALRVVEGFDVIEHV